MKYVVYFLNNFYMNPTHFRLFLSGGVNLVEHFILNKPNIRIFKLHKNTKHVHPKLLLLRV